MLMLLMLRTTIDRWYIFLLDSNTYHNWGDNRSLNHPPEGSVVIHIPATATQFKINANKCKEKRFLSTACDQSFLSKPNQSWFSFRFVCKRKTYPESSKCSLRMAHMVTQIVGVPVKQKRRKWMPQRDFYIYKWQEETTKQGHLM